MTKFASKQWPSEKYFVYKLIRPVTMLPCSLSPVTISHYRRNLKNDLNDLSIKEKEELMKLLRMSMKQKL